MLRTAVEYGLLATVLLLVILVGEHALFLKPSISSWIVGAAAAVVLAVGVWLGRRYFAGANPVANDDARATTTFDSSTTRAAAAGDRATDRAVLGARLERLGISEREHEVLVLVASGLSNQEIADRLFIAETTVKTHVSSLLAKLDARRRTEAVSRAQDEGIL